MNTILNDIFTSYFSQANRTQQFYVHIEMGIDKGRLLWTAIFALEMLIALIGNATAIATFWKRRSTLKRTCYLLIILSVADLLIAIGEIMHLSNNIFYLKNSKTAIWDNILILPDAFAASASWKGYAPLHGLSITERQIG